MSLNTESEWTVAMVSEKDFRYYLSDYIDETTKYKPSLERCKKIKMGMYINDVFAILGRPCRFVDSGASTVCCDIINNLKVGGTFLLNTDMDDAALERAMPNRMKHLLAEKKANFYVIDANKLAAECHMGRHTNTTLQAAFFKLSPKIMPYEEAEKWMKKFVEKTYAKKGMDIVKNNYDAIDAGPAGLRKVEIKPEWINLPATKVAAEDTGDTYYDEYIGTIDRLDGDELPTSEFTKYELLDGTMNANITFRQKRAIADRVPLWNPANCIECNQCAFVCPHATIRPYLINEKELEGAPEIVKNGVKPVMGLPKTADQSLKYRIQISTMNCVGCGLCVAECMANQTAKKMGTDKYALSPQALP